METIKEETRNTLINEYALTLNPQSQIIKETKIDEISKEFIVPARSIIRLKF